MTPDNFINRLPVSLRLIVVFTGLTLLTACGGGSNEKAAKTNTSTGSAPAAGDAVSTATVTTGPRSMEADNQLDFYAEQYLRPEERMKRRQDRIKAALAN